MMIEIKNLRKEWKKGDVTLAAIDDINLTIKKGEIVTIIGPSGCGKTTLLKLIARLLTPTSGSVSIGGDSNKRRSVKKLSIVFQNPVLLPWRDVKDNVRLPNELNNAEQNNNVQHRINLVGLKGFENHYPAELSGGMQQRAAIARALILNPGLLLMDEPFGALDEINRNKLNLELLKIWKRLKSTIVFVTHSVSEAVFLSDRVVILSKRPAKIKEIADVNLPRPRELGIKESLEFQEYVKCIREKID
ncbi:MAG: ABC transporter ATP-binding protein [Nanoarchaeota archaeon]|nr:ABC transporter ATP-binding protein [Nanoarchaeota archaeon]